MNPGPLWRVFPWEHAVAEMIQGYRNSPEPLTNDDLTVWGRRYALVW